MTDQRSTLDGAKWPAQADAQELVQEGQGGHRISLYLDLPERPGFGDLRTLRTSYEGAVEDAAKRMAQLGLDRHEGHRLTEQLLALELHAGVLPPARGSLAVFLGDDQRLSAYVLDRNAQPGVYVGRSFRLRPLLEEIQYNRPYRVLGLSANRVALFEGDAHGLRPFEREGVPHDLVEALGPELDSPSRQGHTVGPGGTTLIAHSSAGDERRVDLERFHTRIVEAVARLWPDRRDPLILFANGTHQGRFHKKAHAHLTGLLPEGVHGHPEHVNLQDLHRQAWAVALAHYLEQDRQAAALVRDAVAHGGTVVGVEGVVMAALAGRVARLWIDAARRVPKHIDPETGALVEAFGDEDAIDEAAAYVIARGGTVVVRRDADMPHPTGIAAELRG